MKLLLQRVSRASVSVDGTSVASIGRGILALVGCRTGDTDEEADWLAARLVALRIFPDEEDRMNRSLSDVGGSALLVSQFTLYADTRKGNRPGFSLSGDPAIAKRLYERLCRRVEDLLGAGKVGTGVFAADMQVELVNDGPVTIELCGDARFPK